MDLSRVVVPEKTGKNELPCSGEVLTGEDAVASALLSVLERAEGTLCLYFCAAEPETAERLAGCIKALPGETDLSWVMPMNGESGSRENYSLMINSFTVFCTRPVTVMKQEEDIGVLLNALFPFYLIADKALLLFDSKLEKAQFFSDPAVISLYRENFVNRTKSSVPFLSSFDKAEPVLRYLSSEMFRMETDLENVYYTVSNVPCIIFDISTSDVQKYTVEQDEQSHDFANMYLNFIANIAKISNMTIDIFSSYGLIDYLDNEEWYELGRHFSKSISKDFRRRMVRSSIEYARSSPNYRSFAIKLPGFNSNAFLGMNVWTSGYMIFLYDFEDRSVVITAKDKGIAGSIVSYIRILQKHGLIASKEETESYVDSVLNERMQEGHTDKLTEGKK